MENDTYVRPHWLENVLNQIKKNIERHEATCRYRDIERPPVQTKSGGIDLVLDFQSLPHVEPKNPIPPPSHKSNPKHWSEPKELEDEIPF